MHVRDLVANDRGAVGEALTLSGAFSEDEVRVALDMFDGGMNGDYALVGVEDEGGLRGYACFGKAVLSRSSWYLYWICVHPACQGRGYGRAIEAAVEESVRTAGGERLVLETSGRADYERSRKFYDGAGFTLVGQIPDFFKPGDDCLIYCKVLT